MDVFMKLLEAVGVFLGGLAATAAVSLKILDRNRKKKKKRKKNK